MKLIDRFVGRELLVNVLFAIAVLSLVLVVGNIFRKLLPLPRQSRRADGVSP